MITELQMKRQMEEQTWLYLILKYLSQKELRQDSKVQTRILLAGKEVCQLRTGIYITAVVDVFSFTLAKMSSIM